MNGRCILLAVTAAWLGLGPASSEDYYRFTPGKGAATAGGVGTGSGGGGTGTQAGTGDAGTKVDPPVPAALAFSKAANLSGSYPANATVEGDYEASGGADPYMAEATGLPDGLYLTQTGPSSWTLSGSVGLQGDYPNGAVTVTDGEGTAVTRTLAMTVLGNAPMSVTSQFTPSVTVTGGEALDVSAAFKGGSGSYDFAVADPSNYGANGYATHYGSVFLSGSNTTPGTYPLKVTVTDTVSHQAVAYDTVTVTVTAAPTFSKVSELSVRRENGQAGNSMEFNPGAGERYFVASGLVRGGAGNGNQRPVTATQSQPSKFIVESVNAPCSTRLAECQALPGYMDGDVLIQVKLTPLEVSETSTLAVSVGDAAGHTVSFATVTFQVHTPD